MTPAFFIAVEGVFSQSDHFVTPSTQDTQAKHIFTGMTPAFFDILPFSGIEIPHPPDADPANGCTMTL